MRRIRYTFDFDDSKMIDIFAAADFDATREQISDLLKKEEDPAYKECSDTVLAIFLNGLINDKRGRKEGEQPEPENKLTNNIIFINNMTLQIFYFYTFFCKINIPPISRHKLRFITSFVLIPICY